MDLFRVWDAQRWRRERDIDVVAATVHLIRSMLDKNSDPRRLRKAMPSWPKSEDLIGG